MKNIYKNHVKKLVRSFPLILLLVAVIASGAGASFALRANYLGAEPYVRAVFEADRSGGDTEKALRDLRVYTYSHMNVDLVKLTGAKPPIQLKSKYEQLVAAEKNRVLVTNEISLKQGEAECGNKFQNPNQRERTQCVQEYQLENGTKEIYISDSLYKFDFVSPRWSPDLAGLLCLIFVLSIIMLLARIVLGFLIPRR